MCVVSVGTRLVPHTAEWRFAARETIVARASAHWTVLVRRQKAHPFVHSACERAVNRLPPRGSPSRHGAQLAHESTVELSHSSSHACALTSLAPPQLCTPRLRAPPAQHPPLAPHAPRHVTRTTPSRRLCVHHSALAPTCRPDARPPPRQHPREHPGTLRRASEPHCATDYNSMGDEGECHAGDRDRWHRALARFACLSPEYEVHDIPATRSRCSVCPRLVSQSPATALSRTYVKRAIHAIARTARNSAMECLGGLAIHRATPVAPDWQV
jgi:hypothetical protein